MKNRLHKISALLLAGMMATGMLAGCGSTASDTADTTPATETAAAAGTETAETAESSTEWTGETSHIIMTVLTGGTDQTDADKIQDAVNAITVPKIGVEVEFRQVSIFDAPSQVPMWIAAGEEIDLYACAFTGISPFIDMNMLTPLNDLLESDGQGILEIADSGSPILDTTKKDATYGVRVLGTYDGRGGGYFLRKDVLEELGYSYQEWDKITLDDLDEILAKIKEAYPDSYQGIFGSLPASGYTFIYDALGATQSSGVLIGTDSTEVVNYYASDEYYNYLKHVRSWYENGYLLKDAATSDISLSEGTANGSILGYFTEGNRGLEDSLDKSSGYEWVTLMINDMYQPSIAPSSCTYWTIPVTAAYPEAAMRFLNEMMTDADVCNLMMWGIEGDHYTYDEETGVTQAADASGRWGLPGIHGNQRIVLGQGGEVAEADAEWNEISSENKTKGYGFSYDASNMTNQITAIDAVVSEYQAALETGSADLDTVYPEFLEKLEANGINDVIADKQAQFDAWLAEQ